MPQDVTGNFDITFKTEKAFTTFGKQWAKCSATLKADGQGSIQQPVSKDDNTYTYTVNFTMTCGCDNVLKNFQYEYNKTFKKIELMSLADGSSDSIDDSDFTATLNACGLPRTLVGANTSNAGIQYSVKFINDSPEDGDVCLFQQQPSVAPGVKSLAWFTKPVNRGTTVVFSWSINYCFVWAQTGELVPGVTFLAGQVIDADLSTANKTTLSSDNGAYRFSNPVSGKKGSLTIIEDATLPPNDVSVGIGMSGFGTFAAQANPNMTALFTPHPEYWIVFGSFTQGDVMDIENLTNPANITFPPNTQAMNATLQSDNTWDIKPTHQANVLLVAAS